MTSKPDGWATSRWFLLLLFLLIAGDACQQMRSVERITVRGSDTEVNLVFRLAEAYMAEDSAVSISIAGGGSGVGIAALLNGKTDVANSSRALTEKEIALAHKRGIRLVAHVFAADALVIVVHPSVGVDSLTLEQLGRIYAGEIRDWAEVGGRPGRISLYGRQSNSGTFVYFREKVLGRDFSPALKQMNGTAQIVESVMRDPYGIGYVGLGYVAKADGSIRQGVRIVRLKANARRPAVSPLDEVALRSGDYPLVRPLYQFTNGRPSDKIKSFFQFETSPAGQQIILENGYLPPWPDMLSAYHALNPPSAQIETLNYYTETR
ncbi:MAG: phosphate ABC transporter substrate-binding protein [Saprospiraceae bacterium]|nr:phosphate ABC transporter substrate-binding protein [Saprospiraceae bacterium]MDW8229134.1 phosphate ABC transporter substrate-binding protein [Saprospiraceae bacterium]